MLVINFKDLQELDLSFYLGLEKYLININDDNDYFFIWNITKSIIIGRHQLLEKEININKAKELGYKIYRRPSGGGAIVADEGCFMFTFISKYKSKDEMYNIYLNKLIKALNKIGFNCYLSGRNDLLFNEKKFSGNSIYYENNKTILHGTFLYDSNLNDIVNILTPSNEKLISKGISSVSSRVINTKPFIKDINNKNDLINYLNNNISDDINCIDISEFNINIIKEYERYYLDNKYIYESNPPYTYNNKIKVSAGIIEVFIDVNKGIIKSFVLKGDFFSKKDLNILYNYFIGKSFNNINNILDNINISDYIENMNNKEFMILLGMEV